MERAHQKPLVRFQRTTCLHLSQDRFVQVPVMHYAPHMRKMLIKCKALHNGSVVPLTGEPLLTRVLALSSGFYNTFREISGSSSGFCWQRLGADNGRVSLWMWRRPLRSLHRAERPMEKLPRLSVSMIANRPCDGCGKEGDRASKAPKPCAPRKSLRQPLFKRIYAAWRATSVPKVQ